MDRDYARSYGRRYQGGLHGGVSLENMCLKSSWLRCRGCGNYRHLNTEALQSANQRPLELLGVTSVEVVCSEIAIGLLILEHVEHDDQDCVTHGHDGALLAFARG